MSLATLLVVGSGPGPGATAPPGYPAALVALLCAASTRPRPRLVAATPDTVLGTVADAIGAAGLGSGGSNTITSSRAIVSLLAEPPLTSGAPLAALRPGRFDVRESAFVGMGRFCAIEEGTFTVSVIAQSNLDQGGQDRIRLLAPALGDRPVNLLGLAQQVKNLLHGEFVVDGDGNHLSVEPVMFRSMGEPRPYSNDPNTVAVDLLFTLVYIPDYEN